ncbi:MAG: ATP-binding protein [Jatrophihabitans sp.]|uniref:sensor histidine kinase n=1 Tax=Jatrophihabitans sp. TaxID=1932789 RepID=UPI003F7DCFA8
MRRAWPRTLWAQLLAGQVLVLVIATAVGLVLWSRAVHHELDTEYEQRALAVAASTAAMPQIVAALEHRDPAGVQALAERIRQQSHASYVVVIDPTGVRYSHPRPGLIGQRISEPVVALDGHDHVGTDPGNLGRSANGRAPVFGTDGRVVGEVSAGVPESSVAAAASHQLVGLAAYLAIVLAAGLLIALLLARRIKRQTYGLELDQFAELLHEREATLHGIREGVLAVDRRGVLTLLNDQAHQLLGTSAADVRRPARDVLGGSDLRRLLPASPEAPDITDLVTVHGSRLLVGSRRRVGDLGHVITLRDRTELDHALRELDETRTLIDALRAQQHEFSNRMHVLSGLLDLGRADEAAGFAREVDETSATSIDSRLGDVRLVALLLAKTTVARERAVSLEVVCDEAVGIAEQDGQALVSIVGNLVDNAIEAVGAGGTVAVRFSPCDDHLVIEVSDDGPGVPSGAEEAIFAGGWSTKDCADRPRGIGLALVRRLVAGLHGSVEVVPGRGGGCFRVTLPGVRVSA